MIAEHGHWVAWQVKIRPSHTETYDHIILAITAYHHPNTLNIEEPHTDTLTWADTEWCVGVCNTVDFIVHIFQDYTQDFIIQRLKYLYNYSGQFPDWMHSSTLTLIENK